MAGRKEMVWRIEREEFGAGTESMWSRNGECVVEERRVCGGGTESMWRRNGEYVEEERRVCG